MTHSEINLSNSSRKSIRLKHFSALVSGFLNPQRRFFGLVLVSGFASLIYEIVWIRQASLAFGSSAIALSTVLAVFFLGLGSGSGLFGQASLVIRQPLFYCAVIEIMLGINGLASTHFFAYAEDVFGHIYRQWQPGSQQVLLLRAGLIVLLLLPPSLLMGATLPLFCKHALQNQANMGIQLSRIYGINTLGATLGCLLAGFVFLPYLGLQKTLGLAAAVNFLLGYHFWRLNRQQSNITGVKADDHAGNIFKNKETSGALLLPAALAFMTGTAGLANELIWARFLSHFVRNSVYSYTTALAVVLAGTGLGSYFLGVKLSRAKDRRDILGKLALLQTLSAVLTLSLTHLPAEFWQAFKQTGVVAVAVLMLPPAVIAGASFPLVNQLLSRPEAGEAARNIGIINSLNIAGCIFGSLITGYFLLLTLGLQSSIRIASVWLLLTALIALIAGYGWQFNRRLHGGIASGALVCLGLILFPPLRIPQDLIDHRKETLIDFQEGYNASLAVTLRQNEKTLLVDWLWQGVAQHNYQVMVAHIPMLHYPDANDVLVIGLGAGTTASRFLHYDIKNLHIVDIEPRIFDFTRKHFPAEWRNDPRVKLLPEDGRNYVKHTAARYDVVSVEIGQLDRPGVGVFYTREFYREVREHLNDHGMISQFLPLRFLRSEDFAAILKTFLSVFPEAQLWYNTDELLLIGSKDHIHRLDPTCFDRLIQRPAIRQDLNFYYWGGSNYTLYRFPVFLSGFLASGAELGALSRIVAADNYTDDKLQLSYQVAGYLRENQLATRLVPYLQKNLTPIAAALDQETTDQNLLQTASKIRELNVSDIISTEILSILNNPAMPAPDPQQVIKETERALTWNPYNLAAKVQLGNARSRLEPELIGEDGF